MVRARQPTAPGPFAASKNHRPGRWFSDFVRGGQRYSMSSGWYREEGRTSDSSTSRGDRPPLRSRGRGAQGQIHGEGAGGQRDGGGQAAWLPALQEQRAAVESDDVPDDGQAHSRPLSGLREQVGEAPSNRAESCPSSGVEPLLVQVRTARSPQRRRVSRTVRWGPP